MGHALTGTARRRLPAAPRRLLGCRERRPLPRPGSSASSSSDLGRRQPDARFRHRYRTSPRASASAIRSPATALPTTPVTVASRLKVPWGLAFLPDGSALVTLRDNGTVLRVRADGAAPVRVGTVPGVQPLGEAGLLGIAVSPRFASDHSVFVYFTAASDNRVMRMTLQDNVLRPGPVDRRRASPRPNHHDGGRLAFGPDGYPLRLHRRRREPPGGAGPLLARRQDPADHPGRQTGARATPSPAHRCGACGHRNVQGLAWDAAGRMYASEFGQDTWDELNLIKPGHELRLAGRRGHGPAGPASPTRWCSGPPTTPHRAASPSASTARLRGRPARRARCGGSPSRTAARARPEASWRDGTAGCGPSSTGPDGRLWIVTSNTVRGQPAADDDR